LELLVAFPARVARDVQQDVPQDVRPGVRLVFPLDALQDAARAFLLVSLQVARPVVRQDVPPVCRLVSPRVVQQDALPGDYSAALRWADQHDQGDPLDDHCGSEAAVRYLDDLRAGC
jgi:hypothetical protein